MTAESYIFLMERISLNIVRCSENISRKLAVRSCMVVDSTLIALWESIILGNWESANSSFWTHTIQEPILLTRSFRKKD